MSALLTGLRFSQCGINGGIGHDARSRSSKRKRVAHLEESCHLQESLDRQDRETWIVRTRFKPLVFGNGLLIPLEVPGQFLRREILVLT